MEAGPPTGWRADLFNISGTIKDLGFQYIEHTIPTKSEVKVVHSFNISSTWLGEASPGQCWPGKIEVYNIQNTNTKSFG